MLEWLADDVAEYDFVESTPKQDGRNMLMALGPTKEKTGTRAEQAKEQDCCMEQCKVNAEVEKAEEARLRVTARLSRKKRGPVDNMGPGIDL